jgi:hypothetical protein
MYLSSNTTHTRRSHSLQYQTVSTSTDYLKFSFFPHTVGFPAKSADLTCYLQLSLGLLYQMTLSQLLPPGFYWGSCYSIFSFICMLCRSLFVLLSFFLWPLCCLFFFDIRILIAPLVSSISSSTQVYICYVLYETKPIILWRIKISWSISHELNNSHHGCSKKVLL